MFDFIGKLYGKGTLIVWPLLSRSKTRADSSESESQQNDVSQYESLSSVSSWVNTGHNGLSIVAGMEPNRPKRAAKERERGFLTVKALSKKGSWKKWRKG